MLGVDRTGMDISARLRGRSTTAKSGAQPLHGTGGFGRRNHGLTVSASPWRCFIRLVLYQAVVNSPSSPGPLLGGIHVDVGDVLSGDYGPWDLDR